MGLTRASTGAAAGAGPAPLKPSEGRRIVALAGNPNVGKSTVFNALTGLRQHTGNWPGKTVASAQGSYTFRGEGYTLVDLPGCYSLLAHSPEEEAARDFLCFGGADRAVVVCDATCLERNLNLVLQVLEITPRTVVCVNLLDEAGRKGVRVDLRKLSRLLGVPVVGTAARGGKGLDRLMAALAGAAPEGQPKNNPPVPYPPFLEDALARLLPAAERLAAGKLSPRWLALRLLEGPDPGLRAALAQFLGGDPLEDPEVARLLAETGEKRRALGLTEERFRDQIVAAIVGRAEAIARRVVSGAGGGYSRRDRRLDRLFTGRATGLPILGLLLLLIFWLTIAGANVPSQLLSGWLFALGDQLRELLRSWRAPDWLMGALLDGVYKTLAWVVSVMLPPMAIFFPLFTLLEDLGYLPRAAFNLDRCFRRCGACGKQALTTAMGFGCNAAGVVGCRIIDSPRERLIAILTNSFAPCNGRLPLLAALIAVFLAGGGGGLGSSALSALLLFGMILLGLGGSLAASKLLSRTLLKGEPSAFTLELPPYRMPQIGRVLVRSVLDRTLFVLGRAAAVAAPAGLVIWLLANVQVGGASLLAWAAGALDPLARVFGLDGVILLAFLLGLPANEIVLPIMVMAYLAQGSLVEMTDLAALRQLLVSQGWTGLTALCALLFALLHWPCSTTLITVYRETKSLKWTAAAFLLPTACGLALCFLTATLWRGVGSFLAGL